MKLIHLSFLSFLGFTFLSGCNEDEPEEMGSEPVLITTKDFAVTIDEDPTEGQILGKVNGTASVGEVSFSLTSQNPIDAMSIDSSSGELKVKNVSAFDFETQQEVTAVVAVESGDVSEEAKVTITITDVPVVVTTADFSASLNENPEIGKSLGMVTGTASEGSVAFSLITQEVADALSIDASTGELKVNDISAFDFETRTNLTAVVTVTGGSDAKEAIITISINNVVEVTTADLMVSLDENPTDGQSIGTVTGKTDTGNLTFSITSQNPSGALDIDPDTGALTVGDSTLFDYETRQSISATVMVKSGAVSEEATVTLTLQDMASTWRTVGTAGFSGKASDIDLAIDQGVPYIVYQDLSNGGRASCMKFEEGVWGGAGFSAFSGSVANETSIAVAEGKPYVFYRDHGYAFYGTARKLSDDGLSWDLVGDQGLTAGTADGHDIDISNGTPYVAYIDGANSNKASVLKFDGSSWAIVGTKGFSAGGTLSMSLAVDSGTPYVAYRDLANADKVTVMKYNGTEWEVVGRAGFSASYSNFVNIVVDNGVPYVAFADGNKADKATVMKYDGTNWVMVGTAGFANGFSNYLSLAMGNGVPYVAYQDIDNSKKAVVMKFDGSTWVTLGDADGLSSGDARYVKLTLSKGSPYVVYSDETLSSKATMMKFDDH